ncbi:MAG: energy transducer TonB [Bacteroidetes bacterium]|nr:MAG: energy transducer TonB [Bacteroidota bacterium]
MTKSKVILADLDDMVFEDRERSYGAFNLRKRYPMHLTIATIVAGVIAIVVTFGPLIARNFAPPEEKTKMKVVTVSINMKDLPPPPAMDEDALPPPPPPKTPPPTVRTVAFQIPEPAPADEIDPEEEQTIADVDELKEAPNIGLEDREGADEVFFDADLFNFEEAEEDIPEVIVEQEPEIDEFIFAEEEPQPINMEDVRQLIGYPDIAREAGIQGSVVVRVLVDTKGNYSKHRIINQVHPLLAKAVEEQIHLLRFTPAIQGGKPIQFWVNIPFNFILLD